ncbi:MAG: hypothetical protein IJS67_03065 [Clostridia bacterium]|nr:hypothetical protein [Clostridia bacterium]
MGKRVAFIGHSNCFRFSSEQLAQVVEKLISQGYDTFAVGTHGDFDRLALIACLDVKRSHPEITIEVVLYDYRQTHPLHGEDGLPRYQHKDIQTVLYPTEELHFKQRITASLHYMIDECDTSRE